MPIERSPAERLLYLERLLESTRDSVVGTDVNSRVTVWNPAAEQMYGFPAEEAVGRPIDELHRERGSAGEIEMSPTAVRNGEGEIVGHIAVHRDVTETRSAGREQRLLASIVECSSDFIGFADLEGKPVFLNEAGRRMVELGDVDIESIHVSDYFPQEARALVRDELLPVLVDEGRWPAEAELSLRNWATGELIPVLWDAFRIDDPHTGEPIAIATITRDLRERRAAADELETRARQRAVVAALGVQALTGGDVHGVMDGAVASVARTLRVELAAVAEMVTGQEQYERGRQEEESAERLGIESLTQREREVMQALADGRDSRGIAELLNITRRTERNHVANILAKLGVHSRLQAVVMCVRYGVVEIRPA